MTEAWELILNVAAMGMFVYAMKAVAPPVFDPRMPGWFRVLSLVLILGFAYAFLVFGLLTLEVLADADGR